MTHYSCSYSGTCEPDPTGEYNSYEDCTLACSSKENKDLVYLIHEYDLESAKLLAPSDRVAVLRRLTGVTLHPDDTQEIIDAILINDYETLVKVDELLPWIRARHPFSLLFHVPAGSLTPEEINSWNVLSDQDLNNLATKYGIKLDNLRSGDIVRFDDIDARIGNLVGYRKYRNTDGCGLGRSPYNIARYGRVDYFRYSLPINQVILVKSSVDAIEDWVISRLGVKLWKVDVGRYQVFTRDIDKLKQDWVTPSSFIVLYYIVPWAEEDNIHLDYLYTESS